MSELIVVAMTGPGLQALEFAKKAGHQTTWLHSLAYDFMVNDEQRERARSLADRTVLVDDLHDISVALTALLSAGVDPARVAGVLTPVHPGAMPAARLAERLGVPGPTSAAVAAAKDKGRCRQILDEAGIPSLGFGVAAGLDDALDVADRIGFPVIVKPATGIGKMATSIARSPADVRVHFAAVASVAGQVPPGMAAELDGRFLVEELAVGPLYSVEVASDGSTTWPLVAVRRKTGRDNPVLELGSTVPAGLSAEQEQEMYDYAVDVCRALGLGLGVFHVEIIRTGRGPRLIEVNPRIAGGAIPDLVAAATGCNLFELLVDLTAGQAVPAQSFPHIAGASHSFLTAADDCTVRSDLPSNWFEEFRPRIHSGWSSIGPGVNVRRMAFNTDVRGVVRVIADDPLTAERECDVLMAEIEATLGITLTPAGVFDQA